MMKKQQIKFVNGLRRREKMLHGIGMKNGDTTIV